MANIASTMLRQLVRLFRRPSLLLEQRRRRHLEFEEMHHTIATLHERSAALQEIVDSSMRELRELLAAVRADQERGHVESRRLLEAMRVTGLDDPGSRRRLEAARTAPDYHLAYEEEMPLVTVIIPTYTNYQMLHDRSIPSVLAQTYENWELVVIGDAAPPETADVIAGFGDERISYENLTLRGPYPDDPHEAWLVTAVPPFNAGLRKVSGRWVVPFADDDALRPQALRRLLETVRSRGLEFLYSQQNYVEPDGSSKVFGQFPPRLHLVGMQGSILHAGLRFFELELSDAVFLLPADWAWLERLLRAGVRVGFLEEVLSDYYPSHRGDSTA